MPSPRGRTSPGPGDARSRFGDTGATRPFHGIPPPPSRNASPTTIAGAPTRYPSSGSRRRSTPSTSRGGWPGRSKSMCGIAGILGRLDEPNRAALARMSQALAHRGPEDAGAWESAPDAAGRGALLAFRRLAILDLSPTGSQPMVDAATGRVLIVNGEIYNYQQLRRSLVARGETVRSTGDAEVLLRMLARHGREELSALRGMFALAAWDSSRRNLLLARHPLGIKPFYLTARTDPSSGWTLAFASELRALLASRLLGTPRLDRTAVASVVWNGFVVGPNTMVEGVELLAAGEARLYDDHGALGASERFWSMPTASGPVGEEELAATLEESVRLHLAADVPLAVVLSRGVRSSAGGHSR